MRIRDTVKNNSSVAMWNRGSIYIVSTAVRITRFQPKGETYSIAEAAAVYQENPDGVPTIDQSSFLIGYPGSGKTLILKKLCWDLLFASPNVPVYVQIEPYVSMLAGDAVYDDRPDESAERDAEIRFLLSLSLVDGCLDSGFVNFAQAGLSALTNRTVTLSVHGEEESSHYGNWKRSVVKALGKSLTYGGPPPRDVLDAPSLAEVAAAIGSRGEELRATTCFASRSGGTRERLLFFAL